MPSVLRISQRSILVSDDSWWKKPDGSAELPYNKLGLVQLNSFSLLTALQICEMKHVHVCRNSESL